MKIEDMIDVSTSDNKDVDSDALSLVLYAAVFLTGLASASLLIDYCLRS